MDAPLSWNERIEREGVPAEDGSLLWNGAQLRRVNGIYRSVDLLPSADQAQTADTFGFKWQKRDTYDGPRSARILKDWLTEKYLDGDPARLRALIPDGAAMLDAGCGGGYSATTFLADRLPAVRYLGADISEAVDVAADRFAERGLTGEFLQADLMALPLPDASFDAIFSEGVLHHTDDTGAAIAALARLLKPGGVFLFYVYKIKAPVREFTDDHIREAIAALDNEAAWDALLPLTRLGAALGELGVTVNVPEAIPYLGIEQGPVDLQRLFYYSIVKCFYDPELSLDEMNHLNFDWFRPKNCHRHSPDEVRAFCARAGLDIERLYVCNSGISVIARRAGNGAA